MRCVMRPIGWSVNASRIRAGDGFARHPRPEPRPQPGLGGKHRAPGLGRKLARGGRLRRSDVATNTRRSDLATNMRRSDLATDSFQPRRHSGSTALCDPTP